MLWIIIGLAAIVTDRLSKYYVSQNLRVGQGIPVITDIFHITYQRNTGAAFSILEGHTKLLAVFTLIILTAFIIYMFVKKPESKLLKLSAALITGGALGNLIDRIRLGYVIDFFDFCFINFPVFNIADCCVVVGAGLMCIYILKHTGDDKPE